MVSQLHTPKRKPKTTEIQKELQEQLNDLLTQAGHCKNNPVYGGR